MEKTIMQIIKLIGIDLGKHSFHVHCQDKSGKALLRKKFPRARLMEFLAPSATVVMEACAGLLVLSFAPLIKGKLTSACENFSKRLFSWLPARFTP